MWNLVQLNWIQGTAGLGGGMFSTEFPSSFYILYNNSNVVCVHCYQISLWLACTCLISMHMPDLCLQILQAPTSKLEYVLTVCLRIVNSRWFEMRLITSLTTTALIILQNRQASLDLLMRSVRQQHSSFLRSSSSCPLNHHFPQQQLDFRDRC